MFKYDKILGKKVSYNPNTDTDYVEDVHTGNPTLDNEDILRLDVNNALEQGQSMHKNWGTNSHAMGARSWDRTRRGVRSATHKTRQRNIIIDLP